MYPIKCIKMNVVLTSTLLPRLGMSRLTSLTLLTLLTLLPRLGMSQTCSLKPTQVAPLYTEQRLDGYQVSHLMGFTLERCLLECFLLKLCASFNYREDLGVCALNNVTANDVDVTEQLVDAPGFVHYDLQAWSGFETMAGTCASRPCAESRRCIQTEPVHTCANVDCGQPPKYIQGKPPYRYYITSSPEMTSLGSRAVFTCNDDWAWGTGFWFNYDAPFYNSSIKICNSDYTWSKNSPACFSRIRTCQDIRDCNSDLPDGHYWIKYEGDPNQRAIIYCHDMTGTPRSFITLPTQVNMAASFNSTGFGTFTIFEKVKIDRDFYVNTTDYTFATKLQEGPFSPFGTAFSCKGIDLATAYHSPFSINTTGTGLAVDPTTSWLQLTVPPGTMSELKYLTLAGDIVTGRCWGNCGRCPPMDDRILLKWSYTPEQSIKNYDTVLSGDIVTGLCWGNCGQCPPTGIKNPLKWSYVPRNKL